MLAHMRGIWVTSIERHGVPSTGTGLAGQRVMDTTPAFDKPAPEPHPRSVDELKQLLGVTEISEVTTEEIAPPQVAAFDVHEDTRDRVTWKPEYHAAARKQNRSGALEGHQARGGDPSEGRRRREPECRVSLDLVAPPGLRARPQLLGDERAI